MHNVRLLLALAAVRQALFPIPVITLFWRHQLGMTLADILLLQAIFALAVTVFELPSGYVADRIGHRQALLVAAVLWIVGWALYAVAGSFAAAVVSEVALGTAMAFASGADSALLYLSLDAEGRAHDYARTEGRLQAAAQTSEAVSAACGGYLYTLAPRLPFRLQLAVAVLGLAVTLPLRQPRAAGPRLHEGHARRLVRLTRLALGTHRRLRSAIALSVILGMSSFVLVWLIQPYMEERGVPQPWFGPVWAVANLWVGAMALASHRLTGRSGTVPVLLGCCLLIAAGYALLAATTAPWGVAFYLLIMTLRGIQIPLLRQKLQADAPDDDRATVLSLNTLLFRLAFAVCGPLIGLVLGWIPLAHVLWLLGAVFTTLALAALAAFARAH